MASKYVDNSSIMQVIGCIYKNPSLLELTDKYSFTEEDFPDKFHKIVFGSIYNLYELGAQKITVNNIIITGAFQTIMTLQTFYKTVTQFR